MKRIVAGFLPVSVWKTLERSTYYEHRSAHRLARTSKRIDICASQIAHLLHMSSHGPVEDKVCLEVGSGWVLSHALVFHILGAKKVIVTDLFVHAHPRALSSALRQSEISLPRDVLAPFSEHSRIRERIDRLFKLGDFTFDTLKSIGIEYISPVDFARQKIDIKADLIYSISVLEHVPVEDVPPLLANLGEMLSPGGAMLHAIHLEDHKDPNNQPFAFLSSTGSLYSREQQSSRGNRIRYSEWVRQFRRISETTVKTIYAYHRRDKPLPPIDASVSYSDEEDLRVSHAGIYIQKI